jgi:hypothetical protein
MPAEKSRQYQSGISGRAGHCGSKPIRRQVPTISLPATMISRFEAYLSIIMHKYSSSVTAPAALSSQKTGLRELF